MAREIHKLTARKVETLDTAGRYADGGNLYLLVGKSGAKSWVFLFRWEGKPREMGLGSAAKGMVTLARARERAGEARAMLTDGQSPLQAKRDDLVAVAAAKAAIPSFGEFAESLLDDIEGGFRNAKHRQQWRNTLTTYCAPIWQTPVPEVDTAGVLKCLSPIWQAKAETASRVRGRIERVLDAAKAKGLFRGENPARWKGHLAATLPKQDGLTRGHHAALAYDALPAFMAELRACDGVSALCLEFTILTAARSGEALNATWAEIDLDAGVWTVPASRMKARKEHRVPLTGRAKTVLATMAALRSGDHVFAGQKPGKPLSVMALAMVLRRMGRDEITVHGFRSAFSDWASEVSHFSTETREACLAHTIANKAEAAYRRGDQFEKRRVMLESWAQWCEPQAAANVVAMVKAKA